MLGLAVRRMTAWSLAERSDDELVAEVLEGRTDAFSELSGRHRQRVERLCQRFFSDSETANDLAQECFLRAFTALDTFRREMAFGAWLRAIAVNLCYDELRRRRRRPEELVPDFCSGEAQWVQLVSDASPEEIVSAAEQRRDAHDLAHRLLESLRPEDRMVLTLKESEGMSVSEIAGILGWSEAKVKIRAFRARQSIRKRAEWTAAARGARLKR